MTYHLHAPRQFLLCLLLALPFALAQESWTGEEYAHIIATELNAITAECPDTFDGVAANEGVTIGCFTFNFSHDMIRTRIDLLIESFTDLRAMDPWTVEGGTSSRVFYNESIDQMFGLVVFHEGERFNFVLIHAEGDG